jgi:DNA-binding response OmpR family regulator
MDFGKKLPVIFLPGKKTEESLAGAFELGVEDYLPKPYDERELLMRVKTVLRRNNEQLHHSGGELTLAGIYIDPGQRQCLVDGKSIRLRPLEFDLLETLMRRSGRVLTRPYLLTTVWDMSSSADTRAVDAMISRLRRSLGRRAGKLIETLSKLGYCFREPG